MKRRLNKFCFRLTKEQLRETMNLTPEMRLEWLEEANNFIHKVLKPSQLERWRKIA